MRLVDINTLVGKDGLFAKRRCPGNCQHCNLWTEKGCRVILEAPTVDAVEVVHSRWVNIVTIVDGLCLGFCENCRTEQKAQNATALKAYHKYCRWCGAKMDGE